MERMAKKMALYGCRYARHTGAGAIGEGTGTVETKRNGIAERLLSLIRACGGDPIPRRHRPAHKMIDSEEGGVTCGLRRVLHRKSSPGGKAHVPQKSGNEARASAMLIGFM